jgi:hypothetical protein
MISIKKVAPYIGARGFLVEPAFSKSHAFHTPEDCCWICHFPIDLSGKRGFSDLCLEMDHVVPQSVITRGGLVGDHPLSRTVTNNTRPTHKYCI